MVYLFVGFILRFQNGLKKILVGLNKNLYNVGLLVLIDFEDEYFFYIFFDKFFIFQLYFRIY